MGGDGAGVTRLLLVLVAWFRLFFGQYYHVVYVGGHPFGAIAQLLLVASYGDARLSHTFVLPGVFGQDFVDGLGSGGGKARR